MEATVAITGASIPVLRVFFREVKSSARAYYMYGTGDETKRSHVGNNTVITTTTRHAKRRNSTAKRGAMDDDDSDKSILVESHAGAVYQGGGIVQTSEITVDYGTLGAQDEESRRGGAFEMADLGSTHDKNPGRGPGGMI